jgi:hypothetical protein
MRGVKHSSRIQATEPVAGRDDQTVATDASSDFLPASMAHMLHRCIYALNFRNDD